MRLTTVSVMFFGAILGCSSGRTSVPEAPPGIANERDREVLERALLHLLAADDFDMDVTSGHKQDAVIVLDVRTPEKTGIIRPEQVQSDIGEGHTVSDEMQRDLLRRNELPGTYDARVASFSELKFDHRIIVADMTVPMKSFKRRFDSFEKAFPKTRGYAGAYLPGYSRDGLQAIVRAWVGPSPHGAMATVVLERSGDTWSVKWYHIAFYC